MEILREGLEKKFFDMCQKCISENGLELYDLEYLKPQKTLRVFIMNSETKTADLNDCVLIDKSLSPYFEESDWIPEDVILEVSSPGLYRKLRTKKHFEMSQGERVKVKFRGDLEGIDSKVSKKIVQSKSVVGDVSDVTNDKLSLLIPLNNEDLIINIDYKNIVKANCEPEI